MQPTKHTKKPIPLTQTKQNMGNQQITFLCVECKQREKNNKRKQEKSLIFKWIIIVKVIIKTQSLLLVKNNLNIYTGMV